MYAAARLIKYAPLIAILALPATALADMASFNKAYKSYNAAIKRKDANAAREAAAKALDEGIGVFDKDGQNIANLRLNYARQLLAAGKDDEAAAQLRQCLAANEAMHGKASPQLLDALMALGEATAASDAVAAKDHFERAIDIAGRTHDAALTAKLELTAGLTLVKQNDFDAAKSWLEKSHDFYARTYGPKDARSGIAALNLGRVYVETRDKPAARKVLESARLAFTGKDPVSKQFDIGARRLLVPLLESLGDHDAATPHCIAIALADANGGSSRPKLLYQAPRGTMLGIGGRNSQGVEVAGQKGNAVVSYTVNEKGEPVDIKLEATDNRSVGAAALKLIKTFRYAPAVENGRTVATQNMQFNYRFKENITVH